jgi:hypothetical protein
MPPSKKKKSKASKPVDIPYLKASIKILRTKAKPGLVIKVSPPKPNYFQVHLLGGVT